MKKFLMVVSILAIPTVMLLGLERLLDHKGAELSSRLSASESIEIPAQPGSKFPFLDSSPGGDIYLSWLEPDRGTRAYSETLASRAQPLDPPLDYRSGPTLVCQLGRLPFHQNRFERLDGRSLAGLPCRW